MNSDQEKEREYDHLLRSIFGENYLEIMNELENLEYEKPLEE